jgi:hypothetical protein
VLSNCSNRPSSPALLILASVRLERNPRRIPAASASELQAERPDRPSPLSGEGCRRQAERKAAIKTQSERRTLLQRISCEVNHPSGQPTRRIRKGVERLRAVAHFNGVTQPFLIEEVQLIPTCCSSAERPDGSGSWQLSALEASAGTVPGMFV